MDLKFVVAENKVELDGCEIFQKEKRKVRMMV